MTIQFLKYIVSVAKIGSITEAAKNDCNSHLDRSRAFDTEVLYKPLSDDQYHFGYDTAGMHLEHAEKVNAWVPNWVP